MDPNSIYDPRHTTGISPVHKDVKHPLIHDPRRPGQSTQLHGNSGVGRSLIALGIWLVFLIGLLGVALWLIFGVRFF